MGGRPSHVERAETSETEVRASEACEIIFGKKRSELTSRELGAWRNYTESSDPPLKVTRSDDKGNRLFSRARCEQLRRDRQGPSVAKMKTSAASTTIAGALEVECQRLAMTLAQQRAEERAYFDRRKKSSG